MAKQSLYEVLGASPDASTADILNCYEMQKWAAEQITHPEERRNLLAFIEYAKEHLADPHKRTLYDRKLQEAAAIVAQSEARDMASMPEWASGSTTLLRLLLLLVITGAAAYAWQHYRKPPPSKTEPVQQLAQAAAPIASSNEVGDGLVFEPAAPVPDTSASSATTGEASASAPPSAAPKKTYEVHTSAADADLVKKLVFSVYAVVGNKGFGTGVMVENERLLTNCHVIAANAHYGKMYAINAVTHEKTEITEVAYLDHQDACVLRVPGLTGQPVPINNFAQMTPLVKTHNIGFAQGNLMSSEGNFRGWAYRFGQKFLVSSNYCDHGVSGGPLVDDDGRLLGLTTGGPADRSYCLSVTADTISALKFETSHPLSDFPDNYTSNVSRRN